MKKQNEVALEGWWHRVRSSINLRPSFFGLSIDLKKVFLSHPNTDHGIEVQLLAKRFGRVLELMNEGRHYDKYTIAKLAQLLKLRKISELENVFEGKDEPSFEFIEDFCKTFGINREWLTEGKWAPYYNANLVHFDPLDYFDDIRTLDPEGIYFILCKSEVGEAFIVLKFADWKFQIFDQIWHISDHVGGGGRRQILGMYRLINKLQAESFYEKCSGRILEEAVFKKLHSGEVFPGSILDHPRTENHWWDDFTDVNHKFPIAENYESSYGKGFIYAQSVVRQKLEEEKWKAES